MVLFTHVARRLSQQFVTHIAVEVLPSARDTFGDTTKASEAHLTECFCRRQKSLVFEWISEECTRFTFSLSPAKSFRCDLVQRTLEGSRWVETTLQTFGGHMQRGGRLLTGHIKYARIPIPSQAPQTLILNRHRSSPSGQTTQAPNISVSLFFNATLQIKVAVAAKGRGPSEMFLRHRKDLEVPD